MSHPGGGEATVIEPVQLVCGNDVETFLEENLVS